LNSFCSQKLKGRRESAEPEAMDKLKGKLSSRALKDKLSVGASVLKGILLGSPEVERTTKEKASRQDDRRREMERDNRENLEDYDSTNVMRTLWADYLSGGGSDAEQFGLVLAALHGVYRERKEETGQNEVGNMSNFWSFNYNSSPSFSSSPLAMAKLFLSRYNICLMSAPHSCLNRAPV
jgi:hypothetical protein